MEEPGMRMPADYITLPPRYRWSQGAQRSYDTSWQPSLPRSEPLHTRRM